MRAAVLRNPSSTKNAGRIDPEPPPGAALLAPDSLDGLDREIRRLGYEGLDLLIIDGGDGTVREVISRLPDAFDQPPLLAIMAHGNTNLIAKKLGSVSDPAHLISLGVEVLRHHAKPAPVLQIDFGAGRGPVRGFIAGWGAYAEGTRIAQEEIAARGSQQVLSAILRTAWRTLFGADAAGLRQGVDSGFVAIDSFESDNPCFIGVLTSLEGRLTGSLNPFWGHDQGAIRWFHVEAPPRHLWLRGPFAAVGLPLSGAENAGYHSGRADQIIVSDPGNIVIDGEVFDVAAGSKLRVTAVDRLHFLRDADDRYSTS